LFLQVFESLAITLDTLQGEGRVLGNHIVNQRVEAEMEEIKKKWDAPRRGPKPKPKTGVVKDLKHPNLGAGYVVPLIEDLLFTLEDLLDLAAEVPPLQKCRPLAFHVFHSVKER
jgi:hypothetical protein